jgi:hypothetical protein
MGGGKSSGSTQAVLTPEQKELLQLQTGALKETFLPAYKSTVTGAEDVYKTVSPTATTAATDAAKLATSIGSTLETQGTDALKTGVTGLTGLFDPQYEQEQVEAALQAGRESARESQAGQNAMYGAAGGLGSSRMALADRNLSSLNAQRQATAAAGARAQVQANKAAASQALMTGGQAGLTGAQQAAASKIGFAGVPQDVYSKYAQVVFGTPQASTTPNFAGTQGQTTSSKGMGFKL